MAEQIKDTQVVKTPEIVIDPRLFVPDGTVGVRNANPNDLVPTDPEQTFDFDFEVDNSDTDTPGDAPGPVASLDTPTGLEIVDQKARTTADGTTVVDVTLWVSDVEGATNYEIRISTG